MSDRLKTILAALFAVSAIVLTVVLMVMSHPSFGKISDLPEFYAASRMVLAGHGTEVYVLERQFEIERLYFPAISGRALGFFINPFALPWIAPLGWLPVSVVPVFWKALLLVSLGIALYLISRIFSLDRRSVCWLIAGTLFSGMAYEALRIDQISTVLLLGFAMAIYGAQRDRPLLCALGLSVMTLKPQEMLPFIAFMLGAKRMKPLRWFLIICSILSVIAFLELGWDGILNYFKMMSGTMQNSMFLQTDLSPTLRGQLFRLFPAGKGVWSTISSIVFAVTLIVIHRFGRMFRHSPRWLEAALAVAMPIGIVTTPYIFDYDLMILIPTVVVLMKEPLQDKIPPWALLTGMLGGLIFMLPFSVNIHYDYLMKGGSLNPYFFALVAFGLGTCIFVHKNQAYFDEAYDADQRSEPNIAEPD